MVSVGFHTLVSERIACRQTNRPTNQSHQTSPSIERIAADVNDTVDEDKFQQHVKKTYLSDVSNGDDRPKSSETSEFVSKGGIIWELSEHDGCSLYTQQSLSSLRNQTRPIHRTHFFSHSPVCLSLSHPLLTYIYTYIYTLALKQRKDTSEWPT